MSSKTEKSPAIDDKPLACSIENEHQISYLYAVELPSLATAFDVLRAWRNDSGFSDCALTMQRYPTLETKTVNTGKTNECGAPVFRERVVEIRNDTRWVLSFDWKTKDPSEARKLDYDFYDNGWPCSVSFTALAEDMVIDKKNGELVPREDLADPRELRAYECVLSVPTYDESRAEKIRTGFENAFKQFIIPLPKHIVAAFEAAHANSD